MASPRSQQPVWPEVLLHPGLSLDMATCGRLPPFPFGRELLETGVMGKPKVNSPASPQHPGLGAGAGASSCAQAVCGALGQSRRWGHRAELGVTNVIRVLAAGWPGSERRADGRILPLPVSQPPSLECRATRVALSFELAQVLYPHFTAEQGGGE